MSETTHTVTVLSGHTRLKNCATSFFFLCHSHCLRSVAERDWRAAGELKETKMRESGIKSKNEGCGKTEILQRNGEEGRGREGRRGKAIGRKKRRQKMAGREGVQPDGWKMKQVRRQEKERGEKRWREKQSKRVKKKTYSGG